MSAMVPYADPTPPTVAAVARPLGIVGQLASSGLDRLRRGTIRFTGASWANWSLLLNRTSIDYSSINPASNSMVVAVVGWIARNFPEAPVRVTVEIDGLREAIKPGPTGAGRMLQILERPNPYFSGVLMWQAVIVDLYLGGNAYLVKIRTPGSGRVSELWWVPRTMLRPGWPEDGSAFIGWYEYSVDGDVYELPVEDVIHFRDGIDPGNPRLGLSKLASLLREVYTDDEASNFTAALLTNLGVPGVIIAPANTTGPGVKADPEAIKTKFSETFGGDNRGGVLALTSPTDVKVLSWSPEQMNLRELRRIPEERVSAVLGVAAGVAGLGAGLDRNTFTNYSEARKAAYEESVIPDQRLMSAELEVQLLPEFVDPAEAEASNMDVDFDVSNVRALQESVESIWKRNESAATKGLTTRATFKRATGQPVAADGSDDVYVMPNNYLTVGLEGVAPAPPPARLPAARPFGESDLRVVAGGPVHCRDRSCQKLLAEYAVPPYRFVCPRCKALTEAEAAIEVSTPQLALIEAILRNSESRMSQAELRSAAALSAMEELTHSVTHELGAIAGRPLEISPVPVVFGADAIVVTQPPPRRKIVEYDERGRVIALREEES